MKGSVPMTLTSQQETYEFEIHATVSTFSTGRDPDLEQLTQHIQGLLLEQEGNGMFRAFLILVRDRGMYIGRIVVLMRPSRAKPVYVNELEIVRSSTRREILTQAEVEFNRAMSEDNYETYYAIHRCVKEAAKRNRQNMQ